MTAEAQDEPFNAGGVLPSPEFMTVELALDECILDVEAWACRRGGEHLDHCVDRLMREGPDG